MGKRLILVLALALVFGLTAQAQAEVQNIKVSGDILLRSIYRATMDLDKGYAGGDGGSGNAIDDVMSHFTSTVRLRVDADLTDNVSAVVRLINERVWGELTDRNERDSTAGSSSMAQDALVELDLAYITMKEFFYSPLTVVLGRQPLRYGAGLIIGDPDTNQFSEYNHNTGTQYDTFVPEDLASLKAFDAVKAILNYDPLVIDLIWAKIDEAVVLGVAGSPENDDVDLYGINVAYDWGGNKNIQQESYIFLKEVSSDGNQGGQAGATLGGATTQLGEDDSDTCFTLGTKVSLEPIERLFVSGEYAMQLGEKYVVDATTPTLARKRDRDAWAMQLIAQYALDMKYSPLLAVSFTHYSGEKNPLFAESGDYEAWDPMFEDQAGGKLYNALFATTNCNTFEVTASVVPIEDLTVALSGTWLWLDKAFNAATTTWNANDYVSTYTVQPENFELGQEVQLLLTYDYTEDVQFGLNAGAFLPGKFGFRNR